MTTPTTTAAREDDDDDGNDDEDDMRDGDGEVDGYDDYLQVAASAADPRWSGMHIVWYHKPLKSGSSVRAIGRD